MSKTFLFLIFLVCVAAGAVFYGLKHPERIPETVMQMVEKRAPVTAGTEPSPVVAAAFAGSQSISPEFSGEIVQGGRFDLIDHIGRNVVVVNFLQSYCGPCRVEIPELNRFLAQYKDKGAVVVGIDVEENPDIVKNFVDWGKIDFPVLVDNGEMARAFRVQGYPTTVVIGLDGQIIFRKLDPVNPPTELEPLVAAQLARIGKESFSAATFLKDSAAAGWSPIQVTPPDIRPVMDSTTGVTRDEIFDIKVIKDEGEQLIVETDYAYSGSHGTSRVYIDCQALTSEGYSPFGMLPYTMEVGRHKAQSPLTSYDGTPKGTVSTRIQCAMSSRIDMASMASRTIDYRKVWKP